MINGTYQIKMKTQMGNKYGQLCLYAKDGCLLGSFNILGHNNPIDGHVLQDGRCHFSGELITPMRSIAFFAKGKINQGSITLAIYTDEFTMPVLGNINI